MKLFKIICLGLFVSFAAISCKDASKNGATKSVQKESLKKIAVGIEGMTCQIGCAKTIESKLSKTEGISSVSVSFENKLGEIVYDENKISKEDIKKKITAIAGGETYSVSSVKEVEKICCAAEKKTCKKKCSDSCTKADCDKCVAVQTECKEKCKSKCEGKEKACSTKDLKTCKSKCESKETACCSADLKKCTMKCSDACTKTDCEKCVAVQTECKNKCATKKQACCASLEKQCVKKCSDSCTKTDCDKCAKATAECKEKCASKK